MFTIARSLVKNKVVILALLVACYFAFAGNKEAPKPKNAWDTVAATQPVTSTAKDSGLAEKALKVLNAGAKMAGVEEYLPAALQEQAISGLNKTEDALNAVNKQQD